MIYYADRLPHHWIIKARLPKKSTKLKQTRIPDTKGEKMHGVTVQTRVFPQVPPRPR